MTLANNVLLQYYILYTFLIFYLNMSIHIFTHFMHDAYPNDNVIALTGMSKVIMYCISGRFIHIQPVNVSSRRPDRNCY